MCEPLVLSMKFLILVFIVSLNLSLANEIQIETPRGDKLEANLSLPNGQGPFPVLIIAPGQGYHKDLPIPVELSAAALKQNYITLRFNWKYQTDGGSPSVDFKNEIEDLESVITYARSLKNSDQNKILMAGKSLGTVVSYEVFQKDQSLHSLYLLTPICTQYWNERGEEVPPFPTMEKYYPLLKTEKRPVHITVGDKDRLCELKMLYEFLSQTDRAPTLSIVGGDHGLNLGPWNDPNFHKPNRLNRKVAIDGNIHWMKLNLD